MLNFSFISIEFENLSFVRLLLSGMLTFKHKKKTTSHFIEVLQNKNAISVNSFPLLKNNEKPCEKINLLRHIKLTNEHKNLIFSKQEFCHVSFLQHKVALQNTAQIRHLPITTKTTSLHT